MIASLKGILTYIDPNCCIIECSGVGFKCYLTGKTLGAMPSIGNEVKLYTFMSVKEEAIDLYGFSEISELECFKLITSVSGVGPKLGLSILTTFSPEQISTYIIDNNPKALIAASGVGLKLAQRIILELKDKVDATASGKDVLEFVNNSGNLAEAESALISLGFSRAEAKKALNNLQSDLPIDTLIKEALKILAR